MPCTKCEEGKYKWGKTGECKYDSLDACESENHKYKMQPTPLGKTYAEYEKELKEFNLSKVEKVELALVDDLVSDAKRMKKGIQELDSLRQKMKKVYLNAIDKANTNRSEFGQKAKELGIDPNDVKEYKDFFSLPKNTKSCSIAGDDTKLIASIANSWLSSSITNSTILVSFISE